MALEKIVAPDIHDNPRIISKALSYRKNHYVRSLFIYGLVLATLASCIPGVTKKKSSSLPNPDPIVTTDTGISEGPDDSGVGPLITNPFYHEVNKVRPNIADISTQKSREVGRWWGDLSATLGFIKVGPDDGIPAAAYFDIGNNFNDAARDEFSVRFPWFSIGAYANKPEYGGNFGFAGAGASVQMLPFSLDFGMFYKEPFGSKRDTFQSSSYPEIERGLSFQATLDYWDIWRSKSTPELWSTRSFKAMYEDATNNLPLKGLVDLSYNFHQLGVSPPGESTRRDNLKFPGTTLALSIWSEGAWDSKEHYQTYDQTLAGLKVVGDSWILRGGAGYKFSGDDSPDEPVFVLTLEYFNAKNFKKYLSYRD